MQFHNKRNSKFLISPNAFFFQMPPYLICFLHKIHNFYIMLHLFRCNNNENSRLLTSSLTYVKINMVHTKNTCSLVQNAASMLLLFTKARLKIVQDKTIYAPPQNGEANH